MSFLLRFKLFLDELEQKKYYQFIALFILLVLGFLTLFMYLHHNRVAFLQKEAKRINKERVKARELLEKHARVQQQKVAVDAVLSQDKTFRIKEYFSLVIQEVRLQGKLSKEPEISEPQDLNNGYSELKLGASFTGITMQELVKLLDTIERNPRIYTKELVITKAPQSQTIDVNLVIATLQPTPQS